MEGSAGSTTGQIKATEDFSSQGLTATFQNKKLEGEDNIQSENKDGENVISAAHGDDEGGPADTVDANERGIEEAQVGSKTKRKSKPKSRRKGGAKPSGFEEYYVDVSTPDEYREERSLYDVSKPVLERIQTAIHRYASRRKFDPMRKLVFDKYMAYGRVKSGPNVFTGGIDDKDPSLTAADISRLRAQHFIADDVVETDIDIDGVTRGFLSSFLDRVVELDEKDKISTAVGVLRNFYNYLLHHDVMPEYKEQIEAAKRTCNVADRELWTRAQVARAIPGAFNESCSLLFGGQFRDTYPQDMEAAKEMGVAPKIDLEKAKKVFVAGLAAQASEKCAEKYNEQNQKKILSIEREFEQFFEIDEIIRPDENVEAMYCHPFAAGLPLTGKIKVKTWHNEGEAPKDLTAAEKAKTEKEGLPVERYEFIIEEDLLNKMVVGLKIRATVRETSFGVFYFDHVTAILPSFYKYMTNEDWLYYKPHRLLPQRETMMPESEGPVEAFVGGNQEGKERETITSLYSGHNAEQEEQEAHW